MFKEIFLFELKQWLKRPGIYIYFAVFFIISVLMGAVISGVFSGATSDTNSHINSATALAEILTAFSSDYLLGLINILICVALMAGCVQKDFLHNCFSFYFTRPVSKFGYLMGRFSASFLLTLFVVSAMVLGLWVSFMIAPNDNGQLGEFKFINFFQPFLLFVLPNTFLIGALFFSLVTFTRNMTSGYVGSLIFLVAAGIARSMTSEIDNRSLAAIVDPFGQQALDFATDYWTPSESNTRLIPFSGYILLNRLFWLAISLGLIAYTYYRFSFNQFLNPSSIFKRKPKERTSQPSKLIQSIGQLPSVTQVFDGKMAWQQFVFLTKFEFRKLTRSIFFYIIVALAILLLLVTGQFQQMIYGTKTYPVTYQQIELGMGLFSFFLLILVVFFSGVVVWRERDSKTDELVGASPIGNGMIFLSKFTSLLLMCLTVNVVCMLTCIGIQTFSGYYNYESGLYVKQLFGMRLFSFIPMIALAVSMQVFFKNRYFAYFTVVLILFALPIVYNAMQYRNPLLNFNSSGEQMAYSDMNGMGHTVGNYFMYKSYWIGLVLIIGVFAAAMYQRGKEYGFLRRFKQALKLFKRQYISVLILGSLLFLGCGSVIYYNIRVLHPYKSQKDQEKELVDYETTFKKYSDELQPRIVASNLNVDIFPDELGFKVKGFYYLKNKHRQPVKKIFFNYENEIKITYSLSTAYKIEVDNNKKGVLIVELSKEMQPGDSLKFDFSFEHYPKNFILKEAETSVVYNGSFFNSGYLPSIGYLENAELADNATRKKYNLAPKPRMASIMDTTAYANTYISKDADWIRFECVLSTKEGQTAIAPGYLQKDWKEGDRHYFHYKMDAPILNFYSFLSANYAVKKDKWINPSDKSNVVNVEIYYHPGHEYNVDRMISAVKKSLDYYTKNFSPYQHKQVRILEFPRYNTFAQSFPNTIPFSEGIGFIAKVNSSDPEEVDYPFYVTAHEVAHQWWAHQVIGADCQGATLMSETMSQYSALMVMEKEYGQAAMRKFLKYEMNTYLQNRSMESRKEVPLLLCENQQYIHYNKGSVVMYALKDYIGEDTLNAALARYIKKVKFQEPPYTTSLDFYSFIEAATPDSLKETLKDLFERIVVFDNSVKSWSYAKTNDGKFKVSAVVELNKTQSDSIGKAKQVAPNDWMDIGVFAKNEKHSNLYGEVLYMKKMKVTGKEQKIEFIIDKEPYMFGIDPYNKLIDKDPGDNSMDKNGKVIGGGSELGGVVVKAE